VVEGESHRTILMSNQELVHSCGARFDRRQSNQRHGSASKISAEAQVARCRASTLAGLGHWPVLGTGNDAGTVRLGGWACCPMFCLLLPRSVALPL